MGAVRRGVANRCCFCEDLAVWLRDRLAALNPGAAVRLYQEDFGWVTDLVPSGGDDTIMVVTTNLDDAEDTLEFGVYVDSRPSVGARLRRMISRAPLRADVRRDVILQIDRLLHQEPRVTDVQWSHEGFGCGTPAEHP